MGVRKAVIIIALVWFIFPLIDTRPIQKELEFLENTTRNGSLYESLNETSITRTPLEDGGDFSNPSEVQKAVCTVTAGDVRASAEAVTTKALKGVCGTKEMHNSFNNLESKFIKELENMESRLAKELEMIKSMISSISACNTTNTGVPSKSIVLLQPIPNSNNDIGHNNSPKLKSKIHTKSPSPPLPSHRSKEIVTNNSTMSNEKDQKIFTYFWKIENFTKKLENSTGISTQISPTFSIKDKMLRVKASFQHMHRDFLFLQLVDMSASLHTSSGNSVILDTAGLFKEIQNGHLKYKMSVIDQNAQRGGKDLVSQEFDNHDSGFLIPNSALNPFVKDDSLVVKIYFYV
ncbi:uncharacterized protein LOC142220848 [Haematobia irritans]|uniref:uncharacterized protein LOC142220848 n=1 Tax=Haematobia irritans TaxID=7368 RepID=UPI003F4F65EE